MKHDDYTFEVPVADALSWQLHKTSLNWELTDRAENDAHEKGVTINDVPIRTSDEGTAKIFVVGVGPIENQVFRVKFVTE